MRIKAGDLIELTIDGAELVLKIEDASKSEMISAKIEKVRGQSAYKAGQIAEFDRAQIEAATHHLD